MKSGKEVKQAREPRKPKVIEALITFAILIAVMAVGIIVYEVDPHVPMFIGTIAAALMALRLGYDWKSIEEAMMDGIYRALQSIIILAIIGILIGVWIDAGVVPTMIYYGLKLLSPKVFLIAAVLICSITSLATGTSWGTAGTMGVALMGIAGALGVSLPATAGAVIAGSYFGDKMSPLSDTTNLAPIAAGSNLYEHIGHMFYTTIPATIVSLIVYAIVGLNADTSVGVTSDAVTSMLNQLDVMFDWNLLLLLPVVLVLAGSLLQKPTIPVMLSSTLLAGVEAIVFQGTSLKNILASTVSGFNTSMITKAGFDAAVCDPSVQSLLTRGGMNGIMSTTLLVFCAFCFAGIMSRAGCLDVVLKKILAVAKSTGSLILATVVSCITMALTTGNSYLSILIPGEMFRDAYRERGLAAKNLSRTLEDAGTVFVPLVPWSAAGAYMTACLGVETLQYLPWAILCYTGFIFAIIYGYTGFGIAKLSDEEKKAG